MNRYSSFGDMTPMTGGEWVRYSDHCEAMKRVWDGGQALQRAIDAAPSAAPVAQGLTEQERDSFVGELVEYGTDFAAPLYAVVEKIEKKLMSRLAPTEPLQGTQEPRRCKVGAKCEQCTCATSDSEANVAAPALTQGTQEPSAQQECEHDWIANKGYPLSDNAPEVCSKCWVGRHEVSVHCPDCGHPFGVAAPAPTQGTQEPVAWMVTHPDLKARPGNETIVQTRESALKYLRGGWTVRPLAHGFAAPAPVGCETRDMAKQGASAGLLNPSCSVFEDMLQSLEHVEAIYRLNVVKDSREPSSTLENLQRVIARAKSASPAALTIHEIMDAVRKHCATMTNAEILAASQAEKEPEPSREVGASPADQVEDARRLDWMAEAKAELRLTVRDDYMLCIGGRAIRTGKTPRAAIDAAMTSPPAAGDSQ